MTKMTMAEAQERGIWVSTHDKRVTEVNCGEDYVTENFRFGPKETEGVRAAQERADLLVTGTVNEETWAALRAQSCECEEG